MNTCCARRNGPAWSDEIIHRNWSELVRVLPYRWLPRTDETGEMFEYGCGSWGCVYPANDPGVVFKLTTDPSEAEFVATSMRLEVPAGIVRYEYIAMLDGRAVSPGDTEKQQQGRLAGRPEHRPVYVLVRETAEDIGAFKVQEGEEGGDTEQRRKASLGLRLFRESADFIRQAIRAHQDEAPELLARAARILRHGTTALQLVRADSLYSGAWLRQQNLRAEDPVIVVPREADADELVAQMHNLAIDSAKAIRDLPDMDLLGGALLHYLDLGLLLCDVHLKNVGRVERFHRWEWAITDPGHMVRLRDDIPRVMPRHIRELGR